MSGLECLHAPRMTRRAALAKGAGGLMAAASLSALLDACGSSSPASSSTNTKAEMTGTLTLLSYPGWYGPHEFADFEKLHPGLTVKNVTSGTNGAAAQIAQISTNKGAYDLTLAGTAVAPELQDAKLLEPLDKAAVPNLSLVAPTFRRSYPWGIPTDFGKTGYGYRSDLIPERPTSWHDFWSLSKKYSGKVTMLEYDIDVQGSALRYLGYSSNSTDKSQLHQMENALLELKPHLQAILQTDYSKPLVEGTAVLAMDYDYDIGAAQLENKHIVWVPPSEGMAGYLEGWVALRGSKHLQAVWEFMNFHLEPKNYASFVNANGPAFVEPAAEPYIMKSIVDNPSLRYDPAELARVEFDTYLGPQATAYRAKLWEEFLAA